jgi:cell division protein ZapA (FtsZ GTPase activity inhibitor)
VFVIRAFGAWMLRIDDVIELQREQTKITEISENIQNKINSDDEKVKLTINRRHNRCFELAGV